MNGTDVLELSMRENDAGAGTIRDYLGSLLLAVWEEGEGFNGKRPFGNSGWEGELLDTLIEAGEVDDPELITKAIYVMAGWDS